MKPPSWRPRATLVALVLLAQPARGVLLSLPAVAAAGFSPDEPEDFPSSRGGASVPEFDDEEEFDDELDQEEAGDVWEDRLERFVTRALNLTKGHGGECAVGTGCGAAAGWLLRKLQGAVVTAAVLSSLGAAGARLLCARSGLGLQPACISLPALLSFLTAPRPSRTAQSPHPAARALCPAPSSPRLLSAPAALPPCGRSRHACAAGALHVGWVTTAQLQAAGTPTCVIARIICIANLLNSSYLRSS